MLFWIYEKEKSHQNSKETNNYSETINVQGMDDNLANEEVIIRSLSGPSCLKAEIAGNTINCTIDKVLGIELVGDTKVRINTLDDVDDWDEIMDSDSTIDEVIDNEVKEDYLDESTN